MDLSTLNWRKSSYSTSNGGNCVEVAVRWRKSSYSTSNGGACVEVGMTPGGSTGNGGGCAEAARPSLTTVAVRDSKDPEGPVLTFSPAAWQAFTSGLKSGDLPTG